MKDVCRFLARIALGGTLTQQLSADSQNLIPTSAPAQNWISLASSADGTRLAAAAGIPPVVVGFSEGMQGSSLNAGNYSAARRRMADGTMRPLWRNAARSLATLLNVPDRA